VLRYDALVVLLLFYYSFMKIVKRFDKLIKKFSFVYVVHIEVHIKDVRVMHRARALSTKMNNDKADGHCYSFAWI